MLTVARQEAVRLLAETLHVDGQVANVTEEEAASTLTFYVTFSNVTDTVAVIVLDARSGAIVTSRIGGGL
jgi:hypothetical protein